MKAEVPAPPMILFPFNVTVAPAQMVEGVAVTLEITGLGLTVTTTVPIEVHALSGSKAVTV